VPDKIDLYVAAIVQGLLAKHGKTLTPKELKKKTKEYLVVALAAAEESRVQ
jgi:hypothetical protein